MRCMDILHIFYGNFQYILNLYMRFQREQIEGVYNKKNSKNISQVNSGLITLNILIVKT